MPSNTSTSGPATATADAASAMLARIPLGRMGESDDIAPCRAVPGLRRGRLHDRLDGLRRRRVFAHVAVNPGLHRLQPRTRAHMRTSCRTMRDEEVGMSGNA